MKKSDALGYAAGLHARGYFAEADELLRQHALIAELLEALQETADYPELDAFELKRMARAAIAKATEAQQ